MKKRKTYEISVIDKTYSKTISDETKFYTSDTSLELVFKLKETEYNFESAEIVLLNIDDRSLVTRPVAKVNNDFVYELDDDITAHYGDWRGQLRFEAGETYVSSPVKFRIENDLGNERPPQLSDVQSWVSLKRYADSLTDELKQAVLSVKGVEDTFNTNETNRQSQFETAEQSRQTTFETNESERDETFNTNEDIRQTQELEREKAEKQRQTVFDDNEAIRTETFNTNESTRQENEATRQQAESQRQSTFEMNESERQSVFETAEQERQSAESIRVENENQRNLTSVDEFIKLQNAVGGRNLVLDTSDTEFTEITIIHSTYLTPYNVGLKVEQDATYAITLFVGDLPVPTLIEIGTGNQYGYLTNAQTPPMSLKPNQINNFVVTFSSTISPYRALYFRFRSNQADNTVVRFNKIKVTKGSIVYPYTKAPEDFTSVSKDDYYNYVKLINDFKDNQFNQLKQAVIALGGTI